MKTKGNFYWISIIYGMIITVLMLLVFGTKLIGSVMEEGFTGIKEIVVALLNWYDDLTGFFLTYLAGYAIVWWKPFWGALIIIIASMLVSLINHDNLGFIIFAIPTFLVGLFFVLFLYDLNKKDDAINNRV
jgi:hypothetical protein